MEEALSMLVRQIGSAADKMGVEMVRLWPQMVMVTWIKSILSLFIQATLVGLSIVGTVWAKRHIGKLDLTCYEDRGTRDWVCGTLAVVWAVVLFVVALSITDAVIGATVPELQTVMDLVRNAKTLMK